MRVLIWMTTCRSWLRLYMSSQGQLACMLENLSIPDYKLRIKTMIRHILIVRPLKYSSTYMLHLKVTNIWLGKFLSPARVSRMVHSWVQKIRLFLKGMRQFQMENLEKIVKRRKLSTKGQQRTNWWIFNSIFTFLKLLENLKCISIVFLDSVPTWLFLLSITLVNLRRL